MKHILSTVALTLTVSTSSVQAGESLVPKPNIIIFYVDDLGWQDVQLNDHGTPCAFETPNIVKLAEAGMNFSQAYSPAPSCAPSRAGIITGQHPAQIKMTHVHLGRLEEGKKEDLYAPAYLGEHLSLDLLTLADAMNQNDYRTGHIGKWHVGFTAESYGFDVVNQTRGIQRGWDDRTKGFATADDAKFPLSKEKYPPFSEKKPEGISYPYDELTDAALQFMEESKEEPFFLNMCHWMVHWPVVTRNGELLEYYCDKMGQPFPPKPGAMSLPGQQNPYFAAMVTSVDWSLGRVVDFLSKTDDPRNPGKKLSETTYIFFSSDNGGAEAKGKEIMSDNFPLKGSKTKADEGGIRVPMVVTGPGVPKASQFDGLVNQLDYFPTILNLTDSTIASKNMKKLSGLDISPVLADASQKVTDANGKERSNLFWYFPHGSEDHFKSAIREGDYKLYNNYQKESYSLYRLYKNGELEDLEEVNDLADNPEYASVLERLKENLDTLMLEHDADGPYLNPNYSDKTDPSAKIKSAEFKQSNRKAKLTLDPSGPKLSKAYVIYQEDPSSAKKHKYKKIESGSLRADIGMPIPVKVSSDGYTAIASIPAGITAFCFMFVDENNYRTFSEVVEAK
ncbi:sulfatase [Rubritalea sp.]|uniref:sulfatase n=1 Tax=Rubritalea sp. TaxID=2109375 RepID=UPI003EFAB43A